MRSGVSAGRSVRRPVVVPIVSIKRLLAQCNPPEYRKSRTTLPLPDATNPEVYHKVIVLSRSSWCECGNAGFFSAFAKLVFYTSQGGCQDDRERRRSAPFLPALFAGSGYIVRRWTRPWRIGNGEELGANWVSEPGGKGRCGVGCGGTRRAERGPHLLFRPLGARAARGDLEDYQGARRHGGGVRLLPRRPRYLARSEEASVRGT